MLAAEGDVADKEGLFAMAGLGEVYSYARACKHLKLPNHWKECMPYSLPDEIPFVEQAVSN